MENEPEYLRKIDTKYLRKIDTKYHTWIVYHDWKEDGEITISVDGTLYMSELREILEAMERYEKEKNETNS